MPQITSGIVRFLQRVNTGDYNHKEASAELSFSVADGESYQAGLDLAGAAALTKVNQILFAPKAAVAETPGPAPAEHQTTVKPAAKGKGGRPPKATEAQLDPTDPRVTGKPDVPTDPAGIDVVTEQAATTADPTDLPEEDAAGIGDLLGEEPPKVITDKDLVSAITQHQAKVQNGPGIRALVAEFAGPAPKTARDITQDKRAAFLEKLVTVGKSGT